MVKTNKYLSGEWYISNNEDELLTANDDNEKIAWKGYQGEIFNTEIAWDKHNLSETHMVSGVHSLIYQGHGQKVNPIT